MNMSQLEKMCKGMKIGDRKTIELDAYPDRLEIAQMVGRLAQEKDADDVRFNITALRQGKEVTVARHEVLVLKGGLID